MVWLPLAKPVGVNEQAPLALAVAVAATAVPSMVKWTTAPGSAVPVRAGLAVILSVAEAPVSLARPAVTTGAVGEGGGVGVVSVKASEALPVLPAASVSLATTVCVPAARPVGVYDQAPVASAVAVPAIALPSAVKCTAAPASPVPLRAGLVVEAVGPLTSFSVTTGALVSRVKASEALPVAPAALVSLASPG